MLKYDAINPICRDMDFPSHAWSVTEDNRRMQTLFDKGFDPTTKSKKGWYWFHILRISLGPVQRTEQFKTYFSVFLNIQLHVLKVSSLPYTQWSMYSLVGLT